MAKLPLIPRQRFKKNGKIDLWDIEIDNGPVKVEFPPILAREALARDPARYKFDLPKGMKPGQLQEEAEERARADAAESEAEPADPHYGRKSA